MSLRRTDLLLLGWERERADAAFPLSPPRASNPGQSSDQELQELLASPDTQNGVVRLQVCETARRASPPSTTDTEARPHSPTNRDGPAPAPAVARVSGAGDDWLEIDSVEDEPLLAGFTTQVYATQLEPPLVAQEEAVAVAVAAAAADPAEPVLPGSFASRLDALIDAEFPRVAPPPSSTSSLAVPNAADLDPAEEPLSPGDPAEDHVPPDRTADGRAGPAFSSLPGSFSSILSGLPSHAGAFSAQLAALVGSPESALGRLSAVLTNPTGAVSSGAVNLADLSSSLSNLGVDVGAAVQEVLQSVRAEAEGVRGEFERFKTEVEAEKARFESEVRAALDEAKRARAEATRAQSSASGPAPAPVPAPATAAADEHGSKDNAGRSTHSHGHGRGHAHAHREAKEARRSAREQRRHDKAAASHFGGGATAGTYESRYSWAPRESTEPLRHPMSGGWCRQPKTGGAAAAFPAKSGCGVATGATSPSATPEATAATTPVSPPAVMRDPPYGMPGSMPFSTPGARGTVPGADAGGATPAAAVAGGSPFADPAPQDADKPVLLTAFLGAARLIGFDVDDANIRVALTDIWCSSSGRGMSAMLDQACEELFS